jgi:serine/threonine protein kinase
MVVGSILVVDAPEPAPSGDDVVRNCGRELNDTAAKARVAAALFGFEPPKPRETDPLRETMTRVGEINVAPRSATLVPEQIARYRIDALIGQGAMGRVFRAHDPELDRTLAIKVLHAEHASDERARTRIVREARALARLSHPNVVHVYDVGEASAGFFIAMEWVPGAVLSSWLRRKARSWNEILAAFVAAGEGLASAHGAGLVHRDFKPDNVMIDDDNRVRVLDFGLARVSSASGGEGAQPAVRIGGLRERGASLTQTGALMGTPIYLAPEVYAGQPADAASDQFSFCVALYEALYGQRPFAGHTLETYAAEVLRGEIRPVPRATRVPQAIEAILARGLSRDPTHRFPSMKACLAEIHTVLTTAGLDARRASIWRRRTSSLPWVLGTSFALVVLVGIRMGTESDAQPSTSVAVPAVADHLETSEGANSAATTAGLELNGKTVEASGEGSGAAGSSDALAISEHEETSTASGPGARAVEGATTASSQTSASREIETMSASAETPVTKSVSPAGGRTDWCSLHEDTFRLLARERKARATIELDGTCYSCRKETRAARIRRFSPGDCAGYQVCGPVKCSEIAGN